MEIPQKQIKGKVIQLYSNEFKRAVCEEYLEGTSSKMDVQPPLAQVFSTCAIDGASLFDLQKPWR